MGVGAEHPRTPVGKRPRVTVLPTTALGRWAAGLMAIFFALVLVGTVVPRGGALAFVSGVTGGVIALTAIVRDRERALTVFAAVLPFAFALAFLLAELIF